MAGIKSIIKGVTPFLPVVGDVIGGLLGNKGQSSANAANLAIARENRQWQEKMSNTAYQRAAKDLEAAGLNRILALGSPSSTPAGNIATMQNENKPLQEGISKGMGTALQAALLKANIRNINARTDYTNAQKDAISPAASLGKAGGSIADKIGETLSPSTIDYDNLNKEFKNPANDAGLKAREKIIAVMDSMGLRADQAIAGALQIFDEMDTPKGLSDDEKLKWILDHKMEVARYLKRKATTGFK